MLIGEYKHSLDDKKRLAIPAKWRRELGRQIVITKGLDHCLFVYTLREWKALAMKLAGPSPLRADTRSFNRFMLAGAAECEIDRMGRVVIPDYLKEFAGLGNRTVIAGVHNRLEIWDEARWQSYKAEVEQKADALAEKLAEIGMF